ncbi:hypothetical protein ROHU_028834 [Labeo rohita]|uniref:Uncharacterized protein n=1 Tax=Labeo rohita TaxID=84645 RepID=A0A498M401_LABRO|nr:hypothetical protein ROHU_028834 [Labeo rohita]
MPGLPQIKLYHGGKRKLRVGDAHDGMGMKRLVVAEVLSVMKMRPLVRILQYFGSCVKRVKHCAWECRRSSGTKTVSLVQDYRYRARIRAEAETAALKARQRLLSQKHALEEQQELLRRKKEEFDLDMELAASMAKVSVFKASEISCKIVCPTHLDATCPTPDLFNTMLSLDVQITPARTNLSTFTPSPVATGLSHFQEERTDGIVYFLAIAGVCVGVLLVVAGVTGHNA